MCMPIREGDKVIPITPDDLENIMYGESSTTSGVLYAIMSLYFERIDYDEKIPVDLVVEATSHMSVRVRAEEAAISNTGKRFPTLIFHVLRQGTAPNESYSLLLREQEGRTLH
jgi:hypothetical protein